MPHLLIKAGPGTGKSHTIRGALSYLHLADKKEFLHKMSDEQEDIYKWCCDELPKSKSVVYLAFQKSIATDLKNKVLPFADVYSLNGFGQSCCIKRWGYHHLNKYRGNNIINKHIGCSLQKLPYEKKSKMDINPKVFGET